MDAGGQLKKGLV